MLSIERSGYYAWLKRKPGVRQVSNENLDKKIVAIFNAHHSRYGAKRISDSQLQIYFEGRMSLGLK